MSRPSALWLFLTTYALLYGAFGMQSPFVPALLRERGLQGPTMIPESDQDLQEDQTQPGRQ